MVVGMSADGTLRFPNPPTHPDVVYVARHVMDHAVPMTGTVATCVGLTAIVVAVAATFRERRASTVAVITSCGLIGCALLWFGICAANSRGTFVGILPPRTHSLAQSDLGDDPHQYFPTAAAALKKAVSTGEGQDLPPSTARAVPLRWSDIPAQDRAEMTGPNPDPSVFPDTGWTEADGPILRQALEKNYGITPTAEDQNRIQHYTEAVTWPGDTEAGSDPMRMLDHSTYWSVPGNPLDLHGEYERYRCLIHLTDYRHNELGQPVSAKIGEVECFSSLDTEFDSTIDSSTPRVVVPPRH